MVTFGCHGNRGPSHRATGLAQTADPPLARAERVVSQVAELKVGDLTVCQVTRVTSAVALVTAQGMPGVIRGPSGSRASVGEHLKIRVTDFDADGARFVAVRLGDS